MSHYNFYHLNGEFVYTLIIDFLVSIYLGTVPLSHGFIIFIPGPVNDPCIYMYIIAKSLFLFLLVGVIIVIQI